MGTDNNIYSIIFILVGYIVIGCVYIWQRQLQPDFIFTDVITHSAVLQTVLSIGILLS